MYERANTPILPAASRYCVSDIPKLSFAVFANLYISSLASPKVSLILK